MTVPFQIGETESAVSGYRFQREDLRIAGRQKGISAFMRIRNGAEFLEASIRSHIEYFDEIVAVYNQCTDSTPDILSRLQQEFGPRKLRIIHYTDQVFPPGSEGHIRTSPNSPNSLVNYYNFSLAATRYQHATKLDDDHLAMLEATQAMTDGIRNGTADPRVMHCFSGLNIFRKQNGRLGVLANDPVSGSGDIGFFKVTNETLFTHDRRYERFQRGGMKRTFAGFLYWHLKYLKNDMGFGNYELAKNPGSRYAKRKARLDAGLPKSLELSELASIRQPGLIDRICGTFSEKKAVMAARDSEIRRTFPDASVDEALQRTACSKCSDDGTFTAMLPPAD